MATATYKEPGDVLQLTATAPVVDGQVVVYGPLIGVAQGPASAGDPLALQLVGQHRFPKSASTGPSFEIGDDVYWDSVLGLAVPKSLAAVDSIYIGPCRRPAASGDTFVEAELRAEPVPYFHGRVWENVSLAPASKVLDIQDVGKVLSVTGHPTNVVTLPATVAGAEYVVRSAADGARLAVSPNPNDRIIGPDDAGSDNEDLTLTAATARRGDYAVLRATAAGWLLVASRGIWAKG